MKILLLAPQSFYQDRGTPIAVDNLLRVFSERGEEVDVVTYHEGKDVEYDNLTIHRIPSPPFVRNVPAGFSLKKLICDLFLVWTVLRLVGRNDYELVHAVEESVFIAMLLKLFYRLPYVYDMDSSLAQQMVEQIPFLTKGSFFFEFWEGLAVKHADAIAPVCDALAEGIERYDPQKVVILHDVSLLEETELEPEDDLRLQLGLKSPMLMYVGNLQSYQGIDLLLESFALALQKAAAELVIIGGSESDIEKYQQMVVRLGIAEHVHFLGPKPLAKLSTNLMQADILVSPRIKGSNTPMKVYSYLHSGTVMLATDLPTHTQVADQSVALLTEPTPTAFAAGMVTLLEDESKRRQLGQAGKQLIEDHYSYPVFQKKSNQLYDWLDETSAQGGVAFSK